MAERDLSHKFRMTMKKVDGSVNDEIVVKYADRLLKPVKINNVVFDGSKNISTIPAKLKLFESSLTSIKRLNGSTYNPGALLINSSTIQKFLPTEMSKKGSLTISANGIEIRDERLSDNSKIPQSYIHLKTGDYGGFKIGSEPDSLYITGPEIDISEITNANKNKLVRIMGDNSIFIPKDIYLPNGPDASYGFRVIPHGKIQDINNFFDYVSSASRGEININGNGNDRGIFISESLGVLRKLPKNENGTLKFPIVTSEIPGMPMEISLIKFDSGPTDPDNRTYLVFNNTRGYPHENNKPEVITKDNINNYFYIDHLNHVNVPHYFTIYGLSFLEFIRIDSRLVVDDYQFVGEQVETFTFNINELGLISDAIIGLDVYIKRKPDSAPICIRIPIDDFPSIEYDINLFSSTDGSLRISTYKFTATLTGDGDVTLMIDNGLEAVEMEQYHHHSVSVLAIGIEK